MEEKGKGLIDAWFEILFCCTLLGLRKQWWTTINDLLDNQNCSAEVEPDNHVAAAAGIGDQSSKYKSMKASREEASVRRKNSINGLHYTGMVLASMRNYKMSAMICQGTLDLRVLSGEAMQVYSTTKGSLYLCVDFANESWLLVLHNTTMSFHDRTRLRLAGYESPGRPSFGLRNSLTDIELDNVIAQKHLNLILALINRNYPFFSSHSKAPPKMLCGLLEPKTEAQVLARAKIVCETFLFFEEQAAAGNATYEDFLNKLVWPKLTWARGLLIRLDEANHFEFTPKETVLDPILKYAEAFQITWIVELAVGKETKQRRTVRTQAAAEKNCGRR